MMQKKEFLKKYSRDLLEGQAAIFAGAGMSIPSGFVNWRDLLGDIADDLGLDIKLEHDLIAVAQYEVNRTRTRDSIDRAIIKEFGKLAQLSENHKLLARLPVNTVWTTNYDTLLETAFEQAKRRADVKHAPKQLLHRNPYADVVIYKMHGDVTHPSDAILTKDDYERYEIDHKPFTLQLLSDLLSKRFLFLGFSFTDPNIEYTINRLRRIVDPSGVSKREHYCMLKEPTIDDYAKFVGTEGERDRAFSIDKKRFEYRVEDLKNYGIQTVAIQKYEEVGELLSELNRRVKTRSVMISGAAEDFGPLGEDKISLFCRILARRLIEADHDIISGVGKGISGSIMIGANEALSRPDVGRIGQRLCLFPFPYWMPDNAERATYYESNRVEMTAQGGITIVISGNKFDAASKKIIDSPGVIREVELAKAAGQFIIPIGATGHAARSMWNTVCESIPQWFPNIDAKVELEKMGDESLAPEELVDVVMTLIGKIRKPQS